MARLRAVRRAAARVSGDGEHEGSTGGDFAHAADLVRFIRQFNDRGLHPDPRGFGIGVDRVVMLMTDQHSIRDVLLYPHLRKEEK